jgi:hypothetical protein
MLDLSNMLPSAFTLNNAIIFDDDTDIDILGNLTSDENMTRVKQS